MPQTPFDLAPRWQQLSEEIIGRDPGMAPPEPQGHAAGD
jgi:hypothetical protein